MQGNETSSGYRKHSPGCEREQQEFLIRFPRYVTSCLKAIKSGRSAVFASQY